MANLIEVVILGVDHFSAVAARVASESRLMGANLLGAGTAMVAMGAGFTAVAAGVGQIAVAGAHFESFTQQIHNETTLAVSDLADMREGLLDLGVETGVAFEELGEGFLNAQNIVQDMSATFLILEAATRSAVATGADASDAARILANVMHEYGLDVAKAADGTLDLAAVQANAARTMNTFHVAAAMGNVTLEEFAKYSSRAIGVAANLGVPLEEVAAAYAALTRHGFDAAASGVQMTNILTKMTNPTIQASKELKRLSELTGVDLVSDFSAAGLHAKGLDGVLRDLQLAFSRMGMTVNEQRLLMSMLDGSLDEATEGFIKQGFSQAVAADKAMDLIHAQRGGLGLATLLNTAWGDYNETLATLTDTTLMANFTQEAFNRTAQTAVFQGERLQRIWQAIAIVIGTAMLPDLSKFLAFLIPLAEATLKFAQAHAELLARLLIVVGVVSAVVGAFLIFGGVLALAAFSAAALAPVLPYLAAGLGATAVAAGAATVVWRNFRDEIAGTVSVAQTTASALRTAFQTGNFNNAFGAIITAISTAFGSDAAGAVTLFVSRALRALQLLRDTIITIGQAWRGEWVSDSAIQPVVRAIGEFVLKVREAVIAVVSFLAPALAALAPIFGFLIDHWREIGIVAGVVIGIILGWPAALIALGVAVKTLALAWADDWGGIREITTAALGAIRNWIDGTALPALQQLWDAISGKVGPAFQALGTWIHDTALPALRDFAAAVGDRVGPVLRAVADWITGTALPALQSLTSFLMGESRSAWNALVDTVEPFVVALRDGLAGTLPVVISLLQGLWHSAGESGSLLDAMRQGWENLQAAWASMAPILAHLRNELEKTRIVLQLLADLAGTYLRNEVEKARIILQLLADLVGPYLRNEFEKLKLLVELLANGIGITLVVAVGALLSGFAGLIGLLSGVLPGAFKAAGGAILIVTGNIRTFAAVVGGAFDVVDKIMRGDFPGAIAAARQASSEFYAGSSDAVKGWGDLTNGVFEATGNGIYNAFLGHQSVWDAYFNAVQNGFQRTTVAANNWHNTLRANALGWSEVATEVANSTGPLTYAQEQTLLLAASQRAAAEQAVIMAGAVGGSTNALQTLEQITGTTALGLKDIDSFGSGAQTRINDLASAVLNSGGAWQGWSFLTDQLKQKLGELAERARDAVDAISNLGSANSQLAGYYSKLEARYDVLAEKQKAGIALTNDEAAEMAILGGAMATLGGEMGANDEAARNWILTWLGVQKTAGDTQLRLGEVNLALSHIGTAGDAATGFVGLTDGMGNIATAGETATTKVNNVKTAIDKVPTTLTVAVDAPNAGAVRTAIDNIQTAINGVSKSFTITAYVNIAPAQQAITDLDNSLPHSPAKEGPLSVLPNWMALFEELPSAAAKAGAEAVTAIASAVTAILAAFVAVARFDSAGNTPSEGQLGWLTTTTTALVGAVLGAAQQFEEDGLKAVERFASAAEKVGSMIESVLSGLKALAAHSFAESSPDGNAMAWFLHLVSSLLITVGEAAAQWDEEALKLVSAFADTAGKVGSMIGDALSGLKALASADFARISPTGSAMGWFTLLIESLVTLVATASRRFSEDALQHASAFAETAGKVVGLIGNALEGLALLASAKWAEISPTGSAMGWFVHLVASLVASFGQAAAQFRAEVLAAATDFATAAGAVVGVIGPAVEGLLAITTIVVPAQAQIDQLLIAIRYVVQKFAEMATMLATEGVEQTEKFAEMVGKVVSAATGATQLFKAFAPDKKGEGGLVIPSAQGIDDLMAGIRYVVQRFTEMATMLSVEGLAAVRDFADGVAKIVAAAKSGADLFKTLGDTKEMPTTGVIDYLVGMIGHLITQTRAIATGIGTEGMQQAIQFASNVVAFITIMQNALDLFPLLAKHKDLPTDALWEIYGALEGALQAAKSAANRAEEIRIEALSFRDKMAEAVKLFAEGLAFGTQIPAQDALSTALGNISVTYAAPGDTGGGESTTGTSEGYGERLVGGFVPERAHTTLPNSATSANSAKGGDTYNITIPVAGSVITEGQLIDKVRNELLRRKRSVPALGLS